MNEVIFTIVLSIIGFFVIVTLIKNYIFLFIAPFFPVREKLRYIKQMKKRKAAGLPQYEPLVSVIVPAWNEEVGVLKTIESIVNNGYRNTELIVVNDDSSDNTEQVVTNYITAYESKSKRHRPITSIRYILQPRGGKGTGLNNGIKAATGDIILTVDADSMLQKGAIEKLVKYYLDDEIMAVVGNVEVINASTIYGLAQQLEYYFGFYNKRAHALMGAEYIFGGACASFRKEVFDKIGLFDTENKTEDIEMSMRTKVYGLKSTYAEDVVCYTEGASDLRGLIAQRIRWKKGRLDTFIKYRSLFFSTKDEHNVALSFFVLPFSLLMEIQLLFEPLAIASIIAYTIITTEYLSLAIGLGFIALVFMAVSLFHSNRPRPLLTLYFPFFWPLFYLLDWIEFLALYKSVSMIRHRKDVEWQNWKRQGITVSSSKRKAKA
jgi:cellulose synthase/poly-beta-1,6-N-acetylglucosamine synthase-like glycosyltransferase